MVDDRYQPITDGCSLALQLRLVVAETQIHFYRQDTGEKLLPPDEWVAALQQESQARKAAEAELVQAKLRAEQAEAQLQMMTERLQALGVDLDQS